MRSPSAREPAPTAAWAVAAVATLGMSVSYVDRQTLAAIAPSVTRALSIDNTRYGWLLGAFSMAYLIGAPTAGIVVDRLGARRGFAAAVVVWSLVAGAHALAFSFASLFLLRVLLGAAEAPSFPAAVQAIRRALPGARRPLAYGLLFTGSSLGAIVAAKLAVGLDAAYGFRGAFAGTALIGALWIPLWLVVTRRFDRDRPPASALAGGEDAELEGPPAPRPSWAAVVTSAPVLRAVVAVVGSAPLMMFVLNWTAKYLVDAWHVPQHDVSAYLVAPPLLFDLGAVGFGALASRRPDPGPDGPTRWRLLAAAMTLAASLALAPLTTSPAGAIALFAVAASGGGGLYVLVTNDMLSRVPIERTSAAGGMTAAAQSLAHVVAGPLVGWTIDRTHGHDAALVGLGVAVVPTTLAFIAWPGVRRPAVGGAPSAPVI
ncbi:MAG: MFS transporter [Labilithrix sp.]|nr:MFS transporter [Labilithrix sp.]MCW5836480.1 MFS transporter [Labilithrix sp.]